MIAGRATFHPSVATITTLTPATVIANPTTRSVEAIPARASRQAAGQPRCCTTAFQATASTTAYGGIARSSNVVRGDTAIARDAPGASPAQSTHQRPRGAMATIARNAA